DTNATFVESPTSVNQSWVQGASSCGYTCKTGFSGTQCTPVTPTNSCATKPSHLTDTNATFVESPTSVNQSWVQGASSCGYTCKTGFSGTQCTPVTPPEPSCTGNHPAAIPGILEVFPYSSSTPGPGAGTANTVYRYGAGSCGWVCLEPYDQNGDIGCKPRSPGSGVIVHVIDAVTGAGFGGVQIIAGTAGMNVGSTITNQQTNNMGDTSEFWMSSNLSGGAWTSIQVIKPGYKILKAEGCEAKVYMHGSEGQVNYCRYATNGGRVNITLIRGDISTAPTHVWTDSSLTSSKSVYTYGETLYGYIRGGDPYDTWACLDGPAAGNSCSSWADYRKLGEESIDGWQVSLITGNIEFNNGLFIASGYDPGVYTGYAKTGQHGTNITSTTFTLR
ncbi:hypothetical protein KBD33_00115, partial [Candidatus Gracilibacteria bacterium]|nr:hypothetical protein [Candidatus Gracilibacteria bacterium]